MKRYVCLLLVSVMTVAVILSTPIFCRAGEFDASHIKAKLLARQRPGIMGLFLLVLAARMKGRSAALSSQASSGGHDHDAGYHGDENKLSALSISIGSTWTTKRDLSVPDRAEP